MQIPTRPLTSCVTWAKLLNLSGPQFPADSYYEISKSFSYKALAVAGPGRSLSTPMDVRRRCTTLNPLILSSHLKSPQVNPPSPALAQMSLSLLQPFPFLLPPPLAPFNVFSTPQCMF